MSKSSVTDMCGEMCVCSPHYTFDPFDRYNNTCTVDSNCDYAKYMHEYGQSLNPAYIRCAITIWGVGKRDNQLCAILAFF